MPEWYEIPYPTGTPVALPGFPRPLYPPDAKEAGRTPSVNGPDVEAYKRVAWRLGRWPGPASNFDRAYSNNFAHGKGGNVVDTGISGLQRQQGIDDTGWIGDSSFQFMRRAIIPVGFTNAGQKAMDAYAQSLLVQAWDQFGGVEPKPEPPKTETVRLSALKKAIAQIGVKESPPFSNRTKYGDWYGMDGNPWCAMFDTWCRAFGATDLGKKDTSFVKGETYAYVPYMVRDARNNRNGLSVTKDPIPGDCICYDWDWDGVFDHTGFFERWTDRSQGMFFAIEGNTSYTNNSNGGEVMRRERNIKSQQTVFIRVVEP